MFLLRLAMSDIVKRISKRISLIACQLIIGTKLIVHELLDFTSSRLSSDLKFTIFAIQDTYQMKCFGQKERNWKGAFPLKVCFLALLWYAVILQIFDGERSPGVST